MSEAYLKPCPFCGRSMGTEGGHAADCYLALQGRRRYSGSGVTFAQLEEAWNRRAPVAPPVAWLTEYVTDDSPTVTVLSVTFNAGDATPRHRPLYEAP